MEHHEIQNAIEALGPLMESIGFLPNISKSGADDESDPRIIAVLRDFPPDFPSKGTEARLNVLAKGYAVAVIILFPGFSPSVDPGYYLLGLRLNRTSWIVEWLNPKGDIVRSDPVVFDPFSGDETVYISQTKVVIHLNLLGSIGFDIELGEKKQGGKDGNDNADTSQQDSDQ